MIIMLLGTHLFLTIRLKFPQRHIFKAIKLSVSRDKDSTGDVSQFAALATALAATIGTGNIVGVGTAIALGGPGAVLWCWLTGVFGIATKYGEGLLAIKYRVQTKKGKMLGGPMYALERGLAERATGFRKTMWKTLAIAFAFFTALATFGIGSTVQAYAISTLSSDTYGVSSVVVGGIVTILVAAVIMGGVKSIARCCEMLVPLMAALYVVGCVVILCINAAYVWPAMKLIVVSAFNPDGVGFQGNNVPKSVTFSWVRMIVKPLSSIAENLTFANATFADVFSITYSGAESEILFRGSDKMFRNDDEYADDPRFGLEVTQFFNQEASQASFGCIRSNVASGKRSASQMYVFGRDGLNEVFSFGLKPYFVPMEWRSAGSTIPGASDKILEGGDGE